MAQPDGHLTFDSVPLERYGTPWMINCGQAPA